MHDDDKARFFEKSYDCTKIPFRFVFIHYYQTEAAGEKHSGFFRFSRNKIPSDAIYIYKKVSAGVKALIYDTDDRPKLIAIYVIEHNSTVRAAAKAFGISKSTVHKDITYRLKRSDPALFVRVRAVLMKNKSERHLRGGNATKLKYERQNIQKNQNDLCKKHIKT